MKPLKYQDIRDQITPGDPIFWKPPAVGKPSIARTSQLVIAAFCGYGHGSISVRMPDEENRKWIVESNFSTGGLVLRYLSEAMERQHGTMYWLHIGLPEDKQIQLSRNEITRAGRGDIKYDTRGCIQKAIDFLTPDFLYKPTMHLQRIYCFGEAYQALMTINAIPAITYAPTARDIIDAVRRGEPVEVDL